MRFKDVFDFDCKTPAHKITEIVRRIPRASINTICCLTYYYGPVTGLIKIGDRIYYAYRFSVNDIRFWVIELTDAEIASLVDYASEYCRLFSTHHMYNPDGFPDTTVHGLYSIDDPALTKDQVSVNKEFKRVWHHTNKPIEPDANSLVCGFFEWWHANDRF